MSRKRTLTEQETRADRLSSRPINVRIQKTLLDDLTEFAESYQSRNKCIVDLIRTHPDFKQFKRIQSQNKNK